MKQSLLHRLPVLSVVCLALIALCLRQDYRVRALSETQLRETLQLIAHGAPQASETISTADLSWLEAYPNVKAASLTGPSGEVLGEYKALADSPATGDLSTMALESSGLTATLSGVLPPWDATSRDLPLMVLTSVLFWVASSRKTQETVPSTTEKSTGDVNFNRHKARLHRLYQAVGDNARDSIVILDSAANVVYGNRTFYSIIGQRPQRDLPSVLELLHPDDRKCFEQNLQLAIEGQPAENVSFNLVGNHREAQLQGDFYALKETSGETLFVVAIFRDIGAARKREREERLSQERALHSQKIEALGRLAGGVAHDFNNLLTSIVFSIESLQVQLPSDSVAQREIDELRIAADKATKVTRQLLLYSRKRPSEASVVGCHGVIRDTSRLAEGMLGRVPTEYRLKATDDRILLDEGQLDQVLLNLLVNAKDAGGKNPKIEVETDNIEVSHGDDLPLSPGKYFRLQVSDNGTGIPEALHAKIFEPYFTTKGVGKGTGLGLSTVVAIVEKGGGHLSFETAPTGTTFKIVLPLHSERPKEPPAEKKPKAPLAVRRNILLVEDESSIRRIVSILLEQKGFQVTSSENGLLALDILKTEQEFDILITDLVLPEVSGPKVAEQFRNRQPDRPVLFMSGFPGDTLDDTKMCSNSQFLAKPFSPEQFFRALEKLLAGQVR